MPNRDKLESITMTTEVDDFFSGYPESKRLFEALWAAIGDIQAITLRVTKTQIAFRHRKAFAWVWVPAKVLGREAAPLVLTVGVRFRHPSSRGKEIVEPYPGRFTHHLELFSIDDIDAEVISWLKVANDQNG